MYIMYNAAIGKKEGGGGAGGGLVASRPSTTPPLTSSRAEEGHPLPVYGMLFSAN